MKVGCHMANPPSSSPFCPSNVTPLFCISSVTWSLYLACGLPSDHLFDMFIFKPSKDPVVIHLCV